MRFVYTVSDFQGMKDGRDLALLNVIDATNTSWAKMKFADIQLRMHYK